MEDVVKAVPESKTYLTAEELDNDEFEVFFVQHPEEMSVQEIEEAFEKKKGGKRADILLTRIDESPVYPVAFNNDGLYINRKIDDYYVATRQ